jgi:hypothetical protein
MVSFLFSLVCQQLVLPPLSESDTREITWIHDLAVRRFFDIYIPVCMLDLYDRRHLPPVRQVDSNSRLICLTCSHNSRKRNGARIMFRHFPTRPNLNRDLEKARTHVTPIDSRSEIAKHPSEILLTLLTILVFSPSFSWLMANDKRERGKKGWVRM